MFRTLPRFLLVMHYTQQPLTKIQEHTHGRNKNITTKSLIDIAWFKQWYSEKNIQLPSQINFLHVTLIFFLFSLIKEDTHNIYTFFEQYKHASHVTKCKKIKFNSNSNHILNFSNILSTGGLCWSLTLEYIA